LIPEVIERRILLIRGQKVMLDAHLADLYEVSTKRLNQQMRRNKKRFPKDFMFQLTKQEYNTLRLHSATLKMGRGQHGKYLPHVFTEQGIAMLSPVLNSERAVMVNIEIMCAFVRLRKLLGTQKDLAGKLEELERKYDRQFRVVFQVITSRSQRPQTVISFPTSSLGTKRSEHSEKPKRPMGFGT